MIPENYSYYKPLPIGLYIGNSDIEGQGLFTSIDLLKGVNLGITHFNLGHSVIRYSKELLRLPLAGHINNSDTPNCIITDLGQLDKPYYYLVILRDIMAGEELTCDYSVSSCGKDTCNEQK